MKDSIKAPVAFVDDEDLREQGIRFSEKGTFLPKDLCLVTLLNWYQDGSRVLSDDSYNTLTDFLYALEGTLHLCDGNEALWRERLTKLNNLSADQDKVLE